MIRHTDFLHRFAWGTDASCYRIIPQEVIISESEQEVSSVLAKAYKAGRAVTFRAAGTSLSGQSLSDSILLVAGKTWEDYHIDLADASVVTLQPGIRGGRVNEILARYGRKLGPDPASVDSAMIGGIVANNASGMSCGIHANSDKLIQSIRIVLADGTVLDTSSAASRSEFEASHPSLIAEICAIRDDVRANAKLVERIRHKYSIKNVTGLNILPFVEYEDPFDIITHLMVGSEGTLAFISNVRMATVAVKPMSASAMVYFKDIKTAAEAVVALKKAETDPSDPRIVAAELLDYQSLRAAEDTVYAVECEQYPDTTAVLLMTEASSEEVLAGNIGGICGVLEGFDTLRPVEFSSDKSVTGPWWAVRSGIFPKVGGMRPEGTTCIIEDIAFHIEDLPAATVDLAALLERHGYTDSCIYGHALEGNFHFIINQGFSSEADIQRYEAMIKDVAAMVVEKYDGSLKAEHGTGRNMAAFVEYEWGSEAFEVMRRVKRAFDPLGILNPGVIFNGDPECYLKALKEIPVIETESSVNKCIECGFCERNCVSCGFTLSSRTRIALNRYMAGLAAKASCGVSDAAASRAAAAELKALEKAYRYPGNVTCAGDGLCSMSCPMGINVGDLTHEIRHRDAWRGVGSFAASHFAGIKTGLKAVLSVAHCAHKVLGSRLMGGIGRGLHAVGMPLWTPAVPGGLWCKIEPAKRSELKVVYLPSCINQSMGSSVAGERPLVEETIALLEKAGYEVILPEGREKLCCGQIWESKGMEDIALEKVRETEKALWEASEHGRYPVLCDQSPCLYTMRKHISSMKLYEPVEFIWTFLRDKLEFRCCDEPVVLHITCSMRKMALGQMLVDLAGLCSTKVVVPEEIGCCGFAGDKGFTNPELNAYALRKLPEQVRKSGATHGYSNSRTCEIGLSTNSGIPYSSIVYLVNRCTE